MSGKRAKKVRKLNGGQRPRANRRGGSGRRLTQEIIDHLKKSLDGDLEKSAEKLVEQHGIPQLDSKYLEVLPGIPVRAYIPSLGRMGSDDDVDTVLNKVRRENSYVMTARKEKDRTGDPERIYPAEGGRACSDPRCPIIRIAAGRNSAVSGNAMLSSRLRGPLTSDVQRLISFG